MEALDYLAVLNDDIKKKLIGLCLDRKLIEDFNEDGETLYDDEDNDEIEEEMEIEEDDN